MSSKQATKILAIMLAVIIAGYACIALARHAAEYKTVTAYVRPIANTVETQMYIIRDEEIIENDSKGVTVPLAENGGKVAAGSELAAIFSDEKSARSYTESLVLEKQLEAYRKIDNQVKLANLDLGKLNDETDDDFNAILAAAYDNDFTDISGKELSFSERLARKNVSLGYEVDCSSVIEELEAKIAALKVKQPKQVITSEKSGYFVSRPDGFETFISASEIDTITPDDLREAMVSKKKDIPENTLGKIITGNEWFAAAILDPAELAGYEVGRTVELVLGDESSDAVKAKIYDKQPADKQQMVIFSCSDMNENLASVRKINGKIVLGTLEGIKINKSAVRFDEKGEPGVYILEGNVIKFNYIKEIYSNDQYVVSEDSGGKIQHLSQYDEIVISGKDLHNGKVVG